MELLKLREYMKCYNYKELRDATNYDVYVYENGNKVIRTFRTTNNKMVYLEHRLLKGSIRDISDIDKISEEFNELNIFVKQVKQQLSK